MDLKEKTANENRHPWELSRADRIIQVYEKSVNHIKNMKIVDIGAGDRYFDQKLITKLRQRSSNSVIYAIDNRYDDTCSGQEDIIIFKDISMIADSSMDCIILMDILEHIPDDNAFLKTVLTKLKNHGSVIITAPAFDYLFSSHDTFLNHYRRYNLKGIKKLILANDLTIIRSGYFYFSLYIARWLQLKIGKNKTTENSVGIGMWEYHENSLLTRSIVFVLNLDFNLCVLLSKLGIWLPGLSLLTVANKVKQDG